MNWPSCWLCGDRPATLLIEAKVLVPYASDGETESHYKLCCDDRLTCLEMTAIWADARDRVHVNTRALTASEAAVISGEDIEGVAA